MSQQNNQKAVAKDKLWKSEGVSQRKNNLCGCSKRRIRALGESTQADACEKRRQVYIAATKLQLDEQPYLFDKMGHTYDPDFKVAQKRMDRQAMQKLVALLPLWLF